MAGSSKIISIRNLLLEHKQTSKRENVWSARLFAPHTAVVCEFLKFDRMTPVKNLFSSVVGEFLLSERRKTFYNSSIS